MASEKKYGGGGRIRTIEAFATDLQSAPFGHSGTPPTLHQTLAEPHKVRAII